MLIALLIKINMIMIMNIIIIIIIILVGLKKHVRHVGLNKARHARGLF